MSNKLKENLDILSRVALLLILILILAIARPEAFWNYSNISTVVFQQAPFTILMSFGMSLAIITKGIDKSMASVVVLASMLSANFFKGEQYLVGLAVALGVGAASGWLNGILITRVGVAPFIATYGTDFIALGLAYVVCNGKYVYDFPAPFRAIANGMLIPMVPNVALITIVIFAVLWLSRERRSLGGEFTPRGSTLTPHCFRGSTRRIQ